MKTCQVVSLWQDKAAAAAVQASLPFSGAKRLTGVA